MKRPYAPPQLPPVVNQRIEAIQGDVRRWVVARKTRDTIERLGRHGNTDSEIGHTTPLYRALIGHHVLRVAR